MPLPGPAKANKQSGKKNSGIRNKSELLELPDRPSWKPVASYRTIFPKQLALLLWLRLWYVPGIKLVRLGYLSSLLQWGISLNT